ncbi:MAG TPA: hypothetical protein VFF68_06440 [Anaerolineaceae bacterium]|nr:hypothetical protein [Anaerolineaceae bacterium]
MSKRITTLMSDETLRQLRVIAEMLGFTDRKRFIARAIERAVEYFYLHLKGVEMQQQLSPDYQPHLVVKTVTEQGKEYRCPICGLYNLVPASGPDAGKTIPIVPGNANVIHVASDTLEFIHASSQAQDD